MGSNLLCTAFCIQDKAALGEEEESSQPCVSPMYDSVRKRRIQLPQDLERWRVVAITFSYISIIITLCLVIASFICAGVSGSTSAFGAGMDTLLSIISSLVIVWRYGESRHTLHDLASQDYKATLSVVLVFLMGSLVVFVVSIKGLLEEHVIRAEEDIMIIFTVAAVCYIALYFLKSIAAERLNSKALTVDAVDSLAAGIISLAILCGAAIVKYFPKVWFVDESLALCIAVIMSIYGLRLLHELFVPKQYSFNLLNDKNSIIE